MQNKKYLVNQILNNGSQTSAYIRITCRLLETQIASPHPFFSSGVGQIICICNEFPGDADAAGLSITLWEPPFEL